MRQKLRAQIRLMVDELVTPMLDARHKAYLHNLGEVKDDLLNAIEKIQPASVDLSQNMADDIVRKIHGPLTIPAQVSEWARKEASYHDMQAFSRVGYSPDALEAIWWIRGNGTLSLELRYPDGSRAWMGTFVPPDFGA